ncbi:NtaA/DmoA family FMN-dependent monooxygenase [Cryobacterium sp.]|jgi:FMN-dependent oxidoreductase (nitrilotriacetate monooxygenase family)|uniref:NtaA/DmoA family FMN-dependent monooxygenase n=1 Tax=Cryobacterium sp. TaxID=1926290 RepID=UPI0026158760|nr:NtaA/DmoA family FMN-dependent monooxygenase [Cryobacterium sp.]MCU1446729.1 monooxygenase [Cryobacterium sp.]
MSKARTKVLHFGVFEVMGPQVGGTFSWTHPRSESIDYMNVDHWIRVVKILEESGFDFLFFAGGYGYPIIDGDLPEVAVTRGINFSGLDPDYLIPVLARHTEKLGFVVTQSTGLDHPVQLARRFSTLDHLTQGRIGWNIVTGASQNAVAEVFGHDQMVPHDTRYEMAGEYVELAARFWETAWDDDALVADRATGVFARREGIHRVEYDGKHYQTRGYYGAPPSPQRTPVLFQAGTSPTGRAFAALNAECVFVQATTPSRTKAAVADLRRLGIEAGRAPDTLKTMAGLTVFVGETEERARELEAEFDALQTDEIVASLYAGNTGIDLLALDPDRTLRQVLDAGGPVGQMGTSNIERFLGDDAPTVREILEQLRGRGTRGFRIVGDPTQIADQIEQLVAETDLDGFLIEPVFQPNDLEDFGRLVMPILRERGRLRDGEAGNTLRARLTERPGNDRLGSAHPALSAVTVPV